MAHPGPLRPLRSPRATAPGPDPGHWREELLAAFTPTGKCGISNGPTEATALIKKVKRIGHGFRNLANYRLRLLLAAGLDWRGTGAVPGRRVPGRRRLL